MSAPDELDWLNARTAALAAASLITRRKDRSFEVRAACSPIAAWLAEAQDVNDLEARKRAIQQHGRNLEAYRQEAMVPPSQADPGPQAASERFLKAAREYYAMLTAPTPAVTVEGGTYGRRTCGVCGESLEYDPPKPGGETT